MNLFSIASYVWERTAIVFFRNHKQRDWIIKVRKRSIDTRKEISIEFIIKFPKFQAA